MRVSLLLPVALCLHAQTPDALHEIRARMTENLERQPNYTCLETVDRARQDRSGEVMNDTVRLEVALVNGKELFGWPGSSEFEDREVQDLISTGMFANGNFALFPRIVFASDAPDFEFRGPTAIDGHPVVRYDFRVPRTRSGYRIRIFTREAIVGFHGSFYADRDTGDIRRLEVTADDLTADLGVLSADNRMDYSRLRIGEEDFLLPTRSEVKMSLMNEVDRNTSRFSSCRRFSGESVLVFTDTDVEKEESKAAPVKPTEVQLPGRTMLELEFRNDLDLTQAAVGDPVQAVLRQKQSLAPKGAVARGRIVKLQRYPGFFLLGIEFRDLEWSGAHAILNVAFERASLILPASRSQRQPVVQAAGGGDILILRPDLTRLKGTVMYWRTQP